MTAVPTLSLVVLAALLAAAVVTDLRSRRIPNRLVLAGLAAAAVLHAAALLAAQPALAGTAAWAPASGALAGLAALLPLYLLRACGAGDVKLMAMVGAFVGVPAVLAAVLATFVAGGLLSVVFMLGRGVAAQTLANLHGMWLQWTQRLAMREGLAVPAPLVATAARLPYALAIASGTLAALAWRGIA